eukprot:PITA_14329
MMLFSTATGMETNDSKSTITTSGCSPHEIQFALHRFPFTSQSLDDGLKYLGFRLKPLHYKIADWIWLVAKIERRLNIWHHKYLSRVGRLILIKYVLEATPIYWISLAWIPKGILMRIQKLCCRFLWKGRQGGRIYAWVCWELIALPKKWGGTGISVIWKAVLNSILYIRDGLTWRLRYGSFVQVGLDSWTGSGNAYSVPQKLITFLSNTGISHLDQIADPGNSNLFSQAWKSTIQLGILDIWHQDWLNYINALTESHIRIIEGDDELIWAKEKHGKYTPKDGYPVIFSPYRPPVLERWWSLLGKMKPPPPHSRLFMWTVLQNKAPTGDNLMKRSFNGPSWCCLCHQDSETIDHLFLHCPVTLEFWGLIVSSLPLPTRWQGNTIQEAWHSWWSLVRPLKARNIPILVCWAI